MADFKLLKGLYPDFLSKHSFGYIIIDISSNQIKLFCLELKTGIKISACKISDFPQEKSNIFILDLLQSFIKDNNILHKNVILIPRLSSCVIKRLELPFVPKEEISQAIKWKIKDELSFNLSNVVLDYQIMNKKEKDGAQILDINCIVAPQEEIVSQVMLLKEIGLRCALVSFAPFGYAKIIQKYLKISEATVGVLNLDEENSYISVYKNGILDFYRELPITIKKFRNSLSDVLITDKGPVKLTPEEINEVLFKGGIPTENSTSVSNIGPGQILAMLRPDLERLQQEIKRSLIYRETQFQVEKVELLLIGGKGIKIPNLEKFLNEEVSLRTKILSSPAGIEIATSVNKDLVDTNLSSIGISLDVGGINLLPREFRSEKIEMAQKLSIRWVALFIFAVFMVYFVLAKVEIGLHQKRLENSQGYLRVLYQVKIAKDKLDKFTNFINTIKSKEVASGDILKVLSNIADPGIFFENFTVNFEYKTGSITGTIKSTDDNSDALLVKLTDGMDDSGYFKDINITSVERSGDDGQSASKFNITFQLL